MYLLLDESPPGPDRLLAMGKLIPSRIYEPDDVGGTSISLGPSVHNVGHIVLKVSLCSFSLILPVGNYLLKSYFGKAYPLLDESPPGPDGILAKKVHRRDHVLHEVRCNDAANI